jgi:hypothetical protein
MLEVLMKDWTVEDTQYLEEAQTFSDLGNIGLKIINRMAQPLGTVYLPGIEGEIRHRPVELVSGPISSGGTGKLEKNSEIMQATILKLKQKGRNVFNQMPFESAMQRIMKYERERYQDHADDLLNGAYLPLLSSGFIKRIHFIHGWITSYGATWEYLKAREFGIKRVRLPKSFLNPRPRYMW